MNDQRADRRRRTLLTGSILLPSHGCIDCVVKNFTMKGACLQVASPVGIPDAFTLVIQREEMQRECRVIWRSATQIGIAFVYGSPTR
jgi:hypothetical protein